MLCKWYSERLGVFTVYMCSVVTALGFRLDYLLSCRRSLILHFFAALPGFSILTSQACSLHLHFWNNSGPRILLLCVVPFLVFAFVPGCTGPILFDNIQVEAEQEFDKRWLLFLCSQSVSFF